MKKLLLLLFTLTITFAQAQFIQDAPWMQDLNNEQRSSNNPITFQETVDAFNTYWETRDPNVRGSGYKPFKRWENYWKNFVKEDGTLPTSIELWRTWETVRNSNSRRSRVDESNWQPVGPYTHINTGSWSSGQGRVNSIIVDPSTFGLAQQTYYSGAPAGGIWKSTDTGATWAPLSDYLPQIGVSGIAVDYNDPDIIYIATGDDDAGNSYSVGVMKSLDGGQTWNTTGLNPGNSPNSMNDIYIHPNDSNILWVATSVGVYKTTDAGLNWTNVQSGNIKDIKLKPIVSPTDPITIYAVTPSRFYKSIDNGDNFSFAVNAGLPITSGRMVIDVTPANPNVVYLLSALNNGFQGLYKSSDSGTSFSTVATPGTVGDIFEATQAWYDMALAVSDTNENEVYTGVLNIWKSSDSGSTFIKVNNWNAPSTSTYTHADIHLLRFYNGELFVGSDGGFYKSSNAATSFTDLTAGMQIGQFYKIAVSKQSSDKMVGGLQDNGGFALNNNQWQNYYGADGMDTAIDPNNSNLYYGFTQSGGGLYISTTSGASSTDSVGSPDGETGNWITPLIMNPESELYAGYSSLYKLCGTGWEAVSTNFPSNIDEIEIDDINPDNIFVGVNDRLHKSIDRGMTFSEVEDFSSDITSIEVNTNDSNVVYVTTSGPGGGVFKSIDGGINYSSITGSLPNITKNAVKHQNFHSQNPLFLATNLGVYRYDDITFDWELFNINLPTVSVTDLEINVYDNKITAATYGRGIWQSDISFESLTDEVSLESIQGIEATLRCDTEISGVQATVKNLGTNVINSVDVEYIIDGSSNNFVWNGTIASNDTQIIDIPTLNVASSGLHTLEIITSTINDSFDVNNQNIRKFYTNSLGVPNIVNTFENASDDLLVSDDRYCDGYWQRGVPTGQFLNNTSSGTQVYGTQLDGEHDDNIKSYLVTPCYDLSTLVNPEISFNMAFELELDWDIVYMEYSTDSGETWNVLGTSSDPNWYNSSTLPGTNCFNCPGAQWTGIQYAVQAYSYNLVAFTNETNMAFRLVFHSDQAVVEEGAIVDDLVVTGTLSTSDFENNSFTIYPNPSNDIFNIRMTSNTAFDFDVYDITGKLIRQEKNIIPNNSEYQLDMSAYASGVYFLNMESDDGYKETKKLILK